MTAAFLNRLRDSCSGHLHKWDFANVSGKQLFNCSFTQGDRIYHYGGRTDLAALPRSLCHNNQQNNSTIVRKLHMVIELKTLATYAVGDNQMIGELLLALYSSEVNVVHGVLTSGSSWKLFWLVRVGNEVVIRRCEVHGWRTGVRHLLAMLNADVENTSRIVPYLKFPSSLTDNDDEGGGDDGGNGGGDDDDEGGGGDGDGGGRRVRPRRGEVDAAGAGGHTEEEEVRDDDLDEMEDYYDEEGSDELPLHQLMQKVIWATQNLPSFANLRSDDSGRLTERYLQRVDDKQSSSWIAL